MTPTKQILTAASELPVAEARRVVALLAKDAVATDEIQSVRDALTEDLRPIGEALFAAYQAGDFAATQAALKKISGSLTDLVSTANLQSQLDARLTDAWLGGKESDL